MTCRASFRYSMPSLSCVCLQKHDYAPEKVVKCHGENHHLHSVGITECRTVL